MKILAIETSCDETGLAVIEASGDFSDLNIEIKNNLVHSQIDIHKEYGGVFPALAKRAHANNISPMLFELLEKGSFEISEDIKKEVEEILEREPETAKTLLENISNFNKPDFDFITVTTGPGLEPALWVGINFAKAISKIWNIPLIPAHHMEGHIASVLSENKSVEFPAISLLISGGHTELVFINNWGEYEIIGETKDDAVGEAYDKVARMLDLEYPGGPKISKLADEFSGENQFQFPRPMINSGDLDFSFSGLKTHILYKVKELGDLTQEQKINIAYEFENTVCDVLYKKTKKACIDKGAKSLIVAGGVIANKKIRSVMNKIGEELNIPVYVPDFSLSTDNAVMIGIAGYLSFLNKRETLDIKAKGNLRINQI